MTVCARHWPKGRYGRFNRYLRTRGFARILGDKEGAGEDARAPKTSLGHANQAIALVSQDVNRAESHWVVVASEPKVAALAVLAGVR